MKFAACDESNIDPETGVCSSVVWVDQPQLFPSISVDAAEQIGGAILLAWAVAFSWRAIGRAISQRSNEGE